MSPNQLPVLYSFRRCPYAIRARLALRVANVKVDIREISLRNKPKELMEKSPNNTVPVLVLSDGMVIHESRDIMQWALDGKEWLENFDNHRLSTFNELIDANDNQFKPRLDFYKYSVRYPEKTETNYRRECYFYLIQLEAYLLKNDYLSGSKMSLADLAIYPFIRQFAAVDRDWFMLSQFIHLRAWCEKIGSSPLFTSVMVKYPQWTGK